MIDVRCAIIRAQIALAPIIGLFPTLLGTADGAALVDHFRGRYDTTC